MVKPFDIWIGSYAKQDEAGLTKLRLDASTGQLAKIAEFKGIENPSFLTLDAKGRYMHVVSEVKEINHEPTGELLTLDLSTIDSGKLRQVSAHHTLGSDPCYVMLDAAERWLAVANYSGSSVTLYPMTEEGIPGPVNVRFRHTGSGPNADRQEAAHPHSAVFSPDGQFLFVPDLGLDKIMVYTMDDKQQWVGHDAVSLPPGAGPRHFKFHPSGKTAFVINELDSTVTRFSYEQPGVLVKQDSLPTLPSSFAGESICAEVVVSPDGRYLYASNRGHDSIAVIKLDEATGELESVGFVSTRGQMPRNFALTPDGKWMIVANQQSDSIVLFSIDPVSGFPVYAGVELAVSKPVRVYIR